MEKSDTMLLSDNIKEGPNPIRKAHSARRSQWGWQQRGSEGRARQSVSVDWSMA